MQPPLLSFPTRRSSDLDRLRQEQLERLGWRFHRIWSTGWFADPDGEVARAVAAYEDAVAAADAHGDPADPGEDPGEDRSEEHTSELQSLRHLVCRLLLE